MISFFALAFGALAAAVLSPPAAAAQEPPVVVELFTSQGCPISPKANALMSELDAAGAGGRELLVLAYGVDYWNLFGWRDRYARPEFVDRQRAYVETGDASRVFTPHLVINGAPDMIRFEPEAVRDRILAAPATPLRAQLTQAGDALTLSIDGAPPENALTLWRVAFTPGEERMRIEAGPNRGEEVIQFNMVTSLERLGEWRGGAFETAIAPPPEGQAVAVLAQAGAGGPILAAAHYSGASAR